MVVWAAGWMLLASGGGDAAAAVVPRPCIWIWSGMMIRTGWLAGSLGWLATGVAGKTAGQAAGTHATWLGWR